MRQRKQISFLVVAVAVAASPIRAQQYAPTYRNPRGEQLVAVYISSSFCVGNRAPGLHEAVDSVKLLLQARAAAGGQQFRAVGVALDWSPDSGLAYLREFGAFDEVNAGRNWFSLGVEHLVWADSTGRPAIPQLLIYRQRIETGGTRVTFSPATVLRRVIGGDSIVIWARSGAPLP